MFGKADFFIGATGEDTQIASVGTSDGGSVHVGDLDGVPTTVKNKWTAVVHVTVHDDSEVPVANAFITGNWSNGAKGSGSCITDVGGQCAISKNLRGETMSVTFTVTDVTVSGLPISLAATMDQTGIVMAR